MDTLDLTEREVAALLLLLKIGMDHYMGEGDSAEAVERLERIPDKLIEGMILKISAACPEPIKGEA